VFNFKCLFHLVVNRKKEKDRVTKGISFNDDIENVVYYDNIVTSCSSTPSSHPGIDI